MLASRSWEALNDVAAVCLRTGAADVLVHVTDLTDRRQVQALFDAALARYGQVDIVISSVGVVAFGRFVDVPPEVFDAVVATTFIGVANLARAALHYFDHSHRGSVVIVGSLLGEITVPNMSAYVSSKFAVNALIRLLQQETRNTASVQVHGVYPGAVNTPIYQRAANYAGWAGRPPPPVDDPALVAAAVVRAADGGRLRISVGLVNPIMTLGFRRLPALFDALIGPVMRIAGLSRTRTGPTTGNVFGNTSHKGASRGPWDHFTRGGK